MSESITQSVGRSVNLRMTDGDRLSDYLLEILIALLIYILLV